MGYFEFYEYGILVDGEVQYVRLPNGEPVEIGTCAIHFHRTVDSSDETIWNAMRRARCEVEAIAGRILAHVRR